MLLTGAGMNRKRFGLLLVGTTALGVVAIAPVRIGDGRFSSWSRVFDTTKSTIGQAAKHVERVILGQNSAADAAKKAAALQVGPVLDAPQVTQDGSALRQAYAVAVANERLKELGYDPAGVLDAITAYRGDKIAEGDQIADKIAQPTVRAALEWVALRNDPVKVSLARLDAFQTAHPDWPAKTWFRHQAEVRVFHVADAKTVERFFATQPPVTALGKFALAKALKMDNQGAEGAKLARALFRDSDLTPFLEGRLKAEFGNEITKSDYKYRADRMLYKDQIGAALRYAALAGPDVVALEKARATIIADVPSDKAVAAVPEALRKDPGLILGEVQRLRRADKLMEAANLMQSAPRDPALLIDGDEWWTERRVLARRLLDNGNINAAYVICATHSAVSNEAKVEAEFHAGWIALRFMNDPLRATYHFGQAAKLAETPTSVARIAYWQGRTAESSSAPDAIGKADTFYRKAAVYGSTYYGQLARKLLGITTDPVQDPAREAVGTQRDLAIQVVELLYAAGEHEAAYALAIDAAKTLNDPKQIAALATVIQNQGDAHLALTIGKIVGQRSIPVDNLAFPTFGIPHYDELQNSAAPPIVYSIARQESAFMPAVVSKAGAKGLMQIIDATAKRTAIKAGVPFDSARLVNDPAFNAQLGAAHLGELMAEQGGSLILTFAAYNAGGGRVKQWIDAYGDPRNPGVDPVDWVERIPFTETRNYVQQVMANVTMYKAIFDRPNPVAAKVPTDREAKL